jgi:cell division protein FtsW (lipid II flippase)
MPELSLIPQIVAGTVVIAWMSGRKKLAGAIVIAAIGAVALSSLFPYVQQRWVGFMDPTGHALGAGYDYRGVAQAVAESEWISGHGGKLPAMSSPTDDYWLAAGLWRVGRIGVLAWVTLFGVTLWLSRRFVKGEGERSLLMHAILATLTMSLAVHAAYNLGIIPVTATYPPLTGLAGSITACQLFLIGFCVAGENAPEESSSGAISA